MLSSNILHCPVCQSSLQKHQKQYICCNHHNFDISKEGYTNLLLKSSKHSGDNAQMIQARHRFLQQGYYQPLQQMLLDVLESLAPQSVVDAGCGEGYYTNAIQAHLGVDVYGFDLSKTALKYASHQGRAHYFLASIQHIPIIDNSVDVMVSVFAPSYVDEYKRILKQDGYIIKVDPHIEHLYELKKAIYDEPYKNQVKKLEGVTLIDELRITYTKHVSNTDILDLFQMTPYFYQSSKDAINKLEKIGELEITMDFLIQIYLNE